MQSFLPYSDFAESAAVLDSRRLGKQRAAAMWAGYEEALVRYGLVVCEEWLCDPAFHRSHQSVLALKDPAHYRHHFAEVPDGLPYVWPPSGRQRRVPVDGGA
jgi:hypothetical protein